jgi:hypothetical protein
MDSDGREVAQMKGDWVKSRRKKAKADDENKVLWGFDSMR